MSASRRIEKAAAEKVISPIASEVIDPAAIARTMRRFPIVPYAGTSKASAHSWLNFFYSLAQQSVLHAACIRKKSIYAFGAPVLLDENGEDVQGDALSNALSDALAPFSFSSTQGKGISNFARSVNFQLEAIGFCVCVIRIATVAGVTRVSISEVPAGWGLRMRDPGTKFDGFVISPNFSDDYLKKYAPEILPQFPDFEERDGVFVSASMISAGGAVNYGRPPAMSASASAFESILNTNYRSSSAYSAFVPRLILEFEAGDATTGPESSDAGDFEGAGQESSFAREFVKRYTNKGDDPPSIMVTERPIGATPVSAIQVNAQANAEYFERIQQINDNQVLAAHGCTRRFIGMESAGGFSKDQFLWDYIVNVEPVIDADRNRFLSWLYEIFDVIFEAYPTLSFLPMRLSFKEPIYDSISEIKNPETNATSDS